MAEEKIVCKFGGTSVADAQQIRKVAAIVDSDPRRRYVIVSAPGKRFSDDTKITDMLLTCWHLAGQKLDYSEPLSIVTNRYHQIATDLSVPRIEDRLWEVHRELENLSKGQESLATRDWMASRGEYLNAALVAQYLDAAFVPVDKCIFFEEEGKLAARSYDLLTEYLSGHGRFVIPGFYGSDPKGLVKTFPRGGSDITGAVVAHALGATIYENWSDVSGFLMADPRIVKNPQPIQEVTYREVRELAYSGAGVFQEEAIFPVSRVGIPIHVKNTNDPSAPGTRILAQRNVHEGAVIGIAGRTGFTAISLEKALMNQEHGFGRRLLEIFEEHGVSFEHVPTAIDSMSVVAAHEQLAPHLNSILKEIENDFKPDRLDVTQDLALIATVGEGMAYSPGISGRLFTALGKARINVRMVSQGASEINIIVAVEGKDYKDAIRAIYEEFAEK